MGVQERALKLYPTVRYKLCVHSRPQVNLSCASWRDETGRRLQSAYSQNFNYLYIQHNIFHHRGNLCGPNSVNINTSGRLCICDGEKKRGLCFFSHFAYLCLFLDFQVFINFYYLCITVYTTFFYILVTIFYKLAHKFILYIHL